jgi:predicted secreted protein
MRASSSTTTMRSGRVLAGVFICNSTFVTAAILPGENPSLPAKPTVCYIYFGVRPRFRDLEHGSHHDAQLNDDRAHSTALQKIQWNEAMTMLDAARTLAAAALTVLSVVHAQPMLPPVNDVLTLAASAAVEVQHDVLAMTLSTTREGPEAAAVQAQVRQAIDAALTEARKAQRPGQLEVRTGAFSLSPRYGSKGNVITGWVGRAELVLEGRDMSAIAQLGGRLSTLTVARVDHSLARETRERAEAEAAAQAIAKFRARAADYAKQFGFSGYSVRQVTVGTSEPGVPPMPRVRAMAAASSDEAIPVEAGKASVTVSVNGSVQMTR